MEFLWQAFEFYHIFILSFGLLLGIMIGSMPGLTPTMGVALTIPFTFSLGATEGLIILGGIYCGSVYGGSIPAILFNVPGAPASVATTFDGYPMTKKGEARKALEVSTIASVIGGIVGMMALLFFAPLFTELSLKFGPTESFWIAMFGLTIIAAISEGSITKNLIGGCIGIYLSFIGIHSITGSERFTFGIDSLVGGFHVVAVLIGLFAFPQALRLIEQVASTTDKRNFHPDIKKSSIRESFSDVLKRPKSVLIGSGLGTIVGVIPGAGGNIASIMAYNEVKRFSKNKDQFGKGDKNGVIASESANNAMVGGSLIPLLTLGIPGSPTAAIFLGGLLIHGIWPGRTLFVENADVAYMFLFSMIAAQILLLFLGLAIIKYMTKLTQIPSHYMAPIILSFSIIGAYTMQNNVFDIYSVVLIGTIMFLLHKVNYAAAPIALGFILGPIAEEGLLHGIQVGATEGSAFAYFFTGPMNIVLSVLVIGTILVSFGNTFLRKQKPMNVTKVKLHHVFSKRAILWLFFLIGSFVTYLWLDRLTFEENIFPKLTLLVMFLLFAVEYGKAIINPKIEEKFNKIDALPVLVAVCIISLLTSTIGFYIQVLLLMIIVPLYVLWKKKADIKLSQLCIVAIGFSLFLYVVFSLIVKVPLP